MTVVEVPPSARAEEESLNRRGARLIARFVRTHPAPMVLSVVGAVAFAAAAVGATIAMGHVTDTVITPAFRTDASGVRDLRSSVVLGGVGLVVLAGVARGVSVVVRRYFAAMLEARMQATLRRGVVHKYLRVPLAFHHERPTGELLAHADADVTGTTMVIKPLPFSIGVLALVVFALASLIAVDWAFTLVALGLFPLLSVLSKIYATRAEQPSALVQQRLGDVSAVAHESFDGALVVKTLGLEAAESERFERAADRLRQQRLVVGRLRAGFEPVLDMLPGLGTVVLLMVGTWRIDAGAATPGDLVQAAALFSILAFPVRVFGFFLEELPRAVVSVERVDGVLTASDAPGARSAGVAVPEGPVGLSFENVRFGYAAGESEVLRGVTFEVRPGETVALVGATGAGKSTVNLLAVRLLEPTGGHVRIGGVDVSDLDPAEVASVAALVFQESFLFAAPVRENVAPSDDVTPSDNVAPSDDVDVDAIARVARVDRFVARLPEGWATVVGERGVTLSGGQRQRVALARALARRPRILLLDDATSAVDPTIEAEILDGLRASAATLLVVAHRLSTITLADRVLFLEDGVIAAEGRHDDLLAVPGYAALVRAYEHDDEARAEAPASDDDEMADE